MIKLHNVVIPVAPPLQGEVYRPLSLHITRGQFFRVCGPTGSGKTALLSTLALRRPPQGELILWDTPIGPSLPHSTRQAHQRRIGFLDEALLLSDSLTLFENIALPLRIQGAPRREVIQETSKIISWLSLNDCAHKKISSVSYTEKLRAACARTLISRPSLVLLEGDLISADQELLSQIIPALNELTHKGSTVVFTSRYTDTFDGMLPPPSLTLPYRPPSAPHNESFFTAPAEDTPTPSFRESLIP